MCFLEMPISLKILSRTSKSSEPVSTNSRDFSTFSFIESVGLTGSSSSILPSYSSGSVSINSENFAAFLSYVCTFLNTGFFVIIFSYCTKWPTKSSCSWSPDSIDLIFCATFLICSALLLNLISLSGSSLISFNLSSFLFLSYHLIKLLAQKRWYPLLGAFETDFDPFTL